MSVAETIRSKLLAELSPSHLEVIDESHLHAGHIGARNRWQRGFNVAKNHVTAHSGRQIEHHINLSIPDPVSDFAKHSRISARRAGFRIAHMAMHHRRPRFGGQNRALGNLLWTARHMGAFVLRRA